MNSKPILFSSEMVRALLDGRKTQTRRVIKPQPRLADHRPRTANFSVGGVDYECPYGQPGGRLWVRETWCKYGQSPIYKADYGAMSPISDGIGGPWKSSTHMPRWASRLTLEIEAVRVERVRDISDTDAWEEGIDEESYNEAEHYQIGGVPLLGGSPERCVFSGLWDSINASRGYGWDANPWVWVIKFKVHRINVDNFQAAPL